MYITPIIPGEHRYPTITPFTIADGQTYLNTLEHLVKMMKDIIDNVNENNEEIYTLVVGVLNTKINEINDALDNQEASVDAKLATLETLVTTTDTELRTYVNNIDTSLRDDVADAVDQVINSSIEVQDPVITGILEDETSSSRQTINDVVKSQIEFPLPNFSGYLQTLSALRSGDPVTVMAAIPDSEKSAILDGTTTYDVTDHLVDILNDDGAASNSHIFFPRGVYRHGNIPIGEKENFKLESLGARSYLEGVAEVGGSLGFEISGDVTNVEISGHEIIGSGVKTDRHAGVWGKSGNTIDNVKIHGMKIRDVVVGISVNANLSGEANNVEIFQNTLHNLVGIASGEGYGIHVANPNGVAMYADIHHNVISSAGRHAIYTARGIKMRVDSNYIINHRNNLTPSEIADSVDGRGKSRSAINVARVSDVSISRNFFDNGYDVAIIVQPDPEGVGDIEQYRIAINQNTFHRRADDLPFIIIGSTQPEITSTPHLVSVDENTFLTVDGSGTFIQHNTGVDVRYRDNTFIADGHSGTVNGIEVFARGGDTYSDRIEITGTRMSGSGVGERRAVRLDGSILTSDVQLTANDNRSDDGVDTLIATTPTNPNARITNRAHATRAWYTDGDTTPSVSNGVTYMRIGNSVATSITTLDDGVEGQIVTLEFRDGNTTLVSSGNLRLKAATDYTPTIQQTITLMYTDTWREIARSEN